MTSFTLIASGIGALGGIIAIFVLIFRIGRRVGQLETEIQSLKQDRIEQKEWGEWRHKVSTLYAIYIEEVVRHQRIAEDRRKNDPQ